MTKQSKQTGKHSGKAVAALTFKAIEFSQSKNLLYLFKANAATLYKLLSINRRVEDKDEGYQRALSIGRVRSIASFIESKRAIPGAIVVCLDKATYSKESQELRIPKGNDVGWVIDGQHRLAGAHMAAKAGTDVELPVVAFLGLDERHQVQQFVTINREGKNVPTSLYLDLLKLLPNKKPGDAARERATDIATEIRRDEESPFFEKIVVTVSPRAGQISLVNFVRKIAPLVVPEKGMLNVYTAREQTAVITNYYKGLRSVFPEEYEKKDSIFFKTIGFGAVWNAFPTLFNLTLKNQQGFALKDVVDVLKRVQSFDFSGWYELGTGNQAEISAGEDFKTALLLAFNSEQDSGMLRV